MHAHASGDKKIGERRIFRPYLMQVWHMQLFSGNWTPALPIGSLHEGILSGATTLLWDSKTCRRFLGSAGAGNHNRAIGSSIESAGGDILINKAIIVVLSPGRLTRVA
jgi:hypothetical protein